MDESLVLAHDPIIVEGAVDPKIEEKAGFSGEDRENCEFCRELLENATPVVHYVNVGKSDLTYDRTMHVYKLTGSAHPTIQPDDPPPPVKVHRQLDRFEESKFWDLMGLNAACYEKLNAQLKKINSSRMVYRKCAYRLHNTRHFKVPLDKKELRREDLLKQTYEDDRKLLKKKQAYACAWEECMHSFYDPQDMRIHYLMDHEGVRFFCCGSRYENYDAFLEHYVTKEKQPHPTWCARECWGCRERFVDVEAFYEHSDVCDVQYAPFACPDPLCPMRFEVLQDCVDHFFLWHDSAGSLACNGVVYPTRESIEPDLGLLDDIQLCISNPLKASYYCKLCKVTFAAENYFTDHVKNHIEKPQLWLVPTVLHCVKCQRQNCRFQRDRLIELIPKLVHVAENLDLQTCHKNPMLLIWRLFLTKEFIGTLTRIYVKLMSENERLNDEPAPGHAPCDDKRLAHVLDSLFLLYNKEYQGDELEDDGAGVEVKVEAS